MTPDDYLAALPDDRRAAIAAVRDTVNANLPPGYEEGIVYGMISWFVPRTRLAETYNGQPLCIASLGSQKSHMAIYMMSIYGDTGLRSWFETAFKQSGKKLDMGKACVRFKTLDAIPLAVIGEAIAKVPVETYVAIYEKSREGTVAGKTKDATAIRPTAKQPATKQPTAKEPTKPPAAKKSAAKPPAAKKSAAKRAATTASAKPRR